MKKTKRQRKGKRTTAKKDLGLHKRFPEFILKNGDFGLSMDQMFDGHDYGQPMRAVYTTDNADEIDMVLNGNNNVSMDFTVDDRNDLTFTSPTYHDVSIVSDPIDQETVVDPVQRLNNQRYYDPETMRMINVEDQQESMTPSELNRNGRVYRSGAIQNNVIEPRFRSLTNNERENARIWIEEFETRRENAEDQQDTTETSEER